MKRLLTLTAIVMLTASTVGCHTCSRLWWRLRGMPCDPCCPPATVCDDPCEMPGTVMTMPGPVSTTVPANP